MWSWSAKSGHCTKKYTAGTSWPGWTERECCVWTNNNYCKIIHAQTGFTHSLYACIRSCKQERKIKQLMLFPNNHCIYYSLNVAVTNHFFTNSDVTVTLQWPCNWEAGAVHHINVLPETPHTELTTALMSHSTITTNLTQHSVQCIHCIKSLWCQYNLVLLYGK